MTDTPETNSPLDLVLLGSREGLPTLDEIAVLCAHLGAPPTPEQVAKVKAEFAAMDSPIQ